MKTDNFDGWVSIHRCIKNNWLYEDKPFNYSMSWIDLILSCNHSDNKILFDHNLITIKRGQMLTSIRKLAERWGWGRDKVSRFLKMLEDDGMIVKESDSKRTLITLVNYDYFQCCYAENRTVNGHSPATDKDTDQAQTIMSNNDNNDNKYRGKQKRFVIPSIEEVRKYCQERENKIDPEYFYDYYTTRAWELAKGRKMKDWKAAIRTWERNSKKWNPDKKVVTYNEKQREGYDDYI